MVERIETDYQGRAIHYAENQDVWKCESLELEAKTLTALKNKMGKLLADDRRVNARPVLIMAQDYDATIKTGNVVLLTEKGKSAWVMVDAGEEWWRGAKRPVTKRMKFAISQLMDPTPENYAAIEEAKRVAKEAQAMAQKAREMRQAIPRLSLEILKDMGSDDE